MVRIIDGRSGNCSNPSDVSIFYYLLKIITMLVLVAIRVILVRGLLL